MARARNIKPGFYKNEDLAECSVWARFIFPGLWMLADREGRLEDRPKRIKAELLPFDGEDVDALLNELQARGFLIRYRNEDGAFIQISAFKKHQTPHYSEKHSAIKPPKLQEDSKNLDPIGEGDTPRGLQESSESTPALKRGSQPPDSLNPDSLNPDKGIVGLSPDPAQPKPSEFRDKASAVIAELNRKTGRSYSTNGANADHVVARLKDGATVDLCLAVIDLKVREWSGDPAMAKYLRPETLFNRTKFATYSGEIGGNKPPLDGDRKPAL